MLIFSLLVYRVLLILSFIVLILCTHSPTADVFDQDEVLNSVHLQFIFYPKITDISRIGNVDILKLQRNRLHHRISRIKREYTV